MLINVLGVSPALLLNSRYPIFLSFTQSETHVEGAFYKCIGFQDPWLMRRVDFVAEYDVQCSLLEESSVQSTLRSIADGNIHQIRAICQQGGW